MSDVGFQHCPLPTNIDIYMSVNYILLHQRPARMNVECPYIERTVGQWHEESTYHACTNLSSKNLESNINKQHKTSTQAFMHSLFRVHIDKSILAVV